MTTFYPYFDGSFHESATLHEVRNPYNGSIVGKTYLCDQSMLDAAIESALSAQEAAGELPVYRRYRSLMKIADGLERRKDEFVDLIVRESAKPFKYALLEVERAIQVFRVAAEESRRLPGEYLSLDWVENAHGKEAWVKYFPIGVIAGISPFNFPLNLAVHKIAPAIAAGCPIVLKPSSLTPLTSLALAQIIALVELPRGMVNILPMNRSTGDHMIADSRIDMISFTGSAEVGWDIKSRAGRKRVLLELGGNAGMIITSTADLQKAIRKALIGGFSYSGQVCIHTQRILVHADLFDTFLSGFMEGVNLLRDGDPLDPSTDVSVMIDDANALRVEQWIEEAVHQGAKLLTGGRRKGKFVEPTVLTSVYKGMKVRDEEIFGPVVCVEPYKNFEEALGAVNDSTYGLQAGLFTYDVREIDLAFRKLKVGGLIVNDSPTFRVDHMPYGGMKNSGLGREGIKYAIFEMMEPKILVKEFLI